jgi:hypothetical protein
MEVRGMPRQPRAGQRPKNQLSGVLFEHMVHTASYPHFLNKSVKKMEKWFFLSHENRFPKTGVLPKHMALPPCYAEKPPKKPLFYINMSISIYII